MLRSLPDCEAAPALDVAKMRGGSFGTGGMPRGGELTIFRAVDLIAFLSHRQCSGNARRPKPARGL